MLRRLCGVLALQAYVAGKAALSKGFTVQASGGFFRFGRRSVLELPVRIIGASRIEIGDDVFVGSNSFLETAGSEHGPALFIGDGTSIAGMAFLSARRCVRLGSRVLLARNVSIADHERDRIAAVTIGDGAWLGQNVVVGPGVAVGRGAVIGANSVVLEDVPAFTVAVGAPARVVRRIAGEVLDRAMVDQ